MSNLSIPATSVSAEPGVKPRRLVALLVGALAWLYLLLVLLTWGCLHYGADRHWLGTLLEFGPRWWLLLPLGPLALAAFLGRRGLWQIGALVLAVVLGPISGLCLPWSTFLVTPEPAAQLRVLTLNTDGVASPHEVLMVIQEVDPEVVFLQECRQAEAWATLLGPTWQVRAQEEFFIASKYPLTELEPLLVPPLTNHSRRFAVRCQASTPLGDVQFVNIHTYSPRRGLEAIRHRTTDAMGLLEKNMQRRKQEAAAIAAWTKSMPGPVIVAGDFNQSAESAAYDELWGDYQNAYSTTGLGWGATFYSRWHGLRIDHVLCSTELQPVSCWVERPVGSAHRPLVAVLQQR